LEQQQHVAGLLLVRGPGKAEEGIDQRVVVRDAVQLVGVFVEAGQTVPRAVHDVEQLGQRKHEVKDLGDEKQKHRLTKVT